MAEDFSGIMQPSYQELTRDPISDGDRVLILGLVEDSTHEDKTVSASEALYSMREKAVRVILDAYATGQYDRFTTYPIHALDACLSESDTALVGSFLVQNPGKLRYSDGYKSIGRVASVEIIPYLETVVGPLSEDSIVDWDTRNRVRLVLELASRAQANARNSDERQAWEVVIRRWLGLRSDHDGSLLFSEDMVETDAPDNWALDAARNLVGSWSEHIVFAGSTRKADHIPAQDPDKRTAALSNLWVRINEPGESPEDHSKISQRLLRSASREEYGSSPLAVLMGIEIEVEEASLIRDVAVVDTPNGRFDRMSRILRGFRLVEQDGIPAGKDEEWEYAHLPARHYRTLLREVQALSRLGLLNLEYPNPLHVTLGDITQTGLGGEETYVLAQSMLATGWSTTGDRIRQPLSKDYGTWAHLSKGGVYERESADIMAPSDTAVEFRVHIAEGLGNLALTLRSYYQLGSALRAFQVRSRGQELDACQTKLADVWSDFSVSACRLFADCQLADPRLGPWYAEAQDSSRGKTKELDRNYLELASMLDVASNSSTGRAVQTRGAFRQAVINHGGKANKILDSTRVAHSS